MKIKDQKRAGRTWYAIFDGESRVSRWFPSWSQANDVLKLLEK